MRKGYFVLFAVLLLLISSRLVVPSNAETVTKTFTLTHFDVTLTFPKTANPDESILISVNAVAKSSIRVRDVSIQVLAYMEGGDLQSIGSTSLANDQYLNKGETLHKELSVTVPSSIPRGGLVAVVSETIRSMTYSYYYPYYYYYGYYYWYYPNYTYYWYYPYYYSYYPETTNREYVESKTLPCSYVVATTPEYVELESEYDELSSKYSDLSTNYQQTTEQNKELSNKLAITTQDLNNARILAYAFMAATTILAAVAAFFIFVYVRKRTGAPPPVSTSVSRPPHVTEPEKTASEHGKKEVPKRTPRS